MKLIKIFAIFLLFSFISSFVDTPVHAQANVSCDSANYINRSYVDVVVPTGGTATKNVNLWITNPGFGMRILVSRSGTNVATITNNSAPVNGVLVNTFAANPGDTLRYTFQFDMGSSFVDVPRWMPTNLGAYSQTCGTGCPSPSGGNFGLVNIAGMYNLASTSGVTPYDLTTGGASLFGTRTLLQDKVVTCWNDNAGTSDTDFNDFSAMWTIAGATLSAPAVVTNPATGVTSSTAVLNGNVTSDGGSPITERGFAYSRTETTPTLANGTRVTTTGTTGALSTTIPVTPGTYYFQAYAINAYGTTYGGVQQFVVTAGTTPTPTPTVSPSPTATHAPEETGIVEDSLIYTGLALYVFGITAFIGSKAITRKLAVEGSGKMP